MAALLTFAPLWAGEKMTDDKIYDAVRLKLVSDPDVKGGALEVVVTDGEVTLRGAVPSEHGRQKAEHLTKKVKGVKKVHNELVVKVQ